MDHGLMEWVGARCTMSPDARTPRAALHESYCEYRRGRWALIKHGNDPGALGEFGSILNRVQFAEALRIAGLREARDAAGIVVVGLGLNALPDSRAAGLDGWISVCCERGFRESVAVKDAFLSYTEHMLASGYGSLSYTAWQQSMTIKGYTRSKGRYLGLGLRKPASEETAIDVAALPPEDKF